MKENEYLLYSLKDIENYLLIFQIHLRKINVFIQNCSTHKEFASQIFRQYTSDDEHRTNLLLVVHQLEHTVHGRLKTEYNSLVEEHIEKTKQLYTLEKELIPFKVKLANELEDLVMTCQFHSFKMAARHLNALKHDFSRKIQDSRLAIEEVIGQLAEFKATFHCSQTDIDNYLNAKDISVHQNIEKINRNVITPEVYSQDNFNILSSTHDKHTKKKRKLRKTKTMTMKTLQENKKLPPSSHPNDIQAGKKKVNMKTLQENKKLPSSSHPNDNDIQAGKKKVNMKTLKENKKLPQFLYNLHHNKPLPLGLIKIKKTEEGPQKKHSFLKRSIVDPCKQKQVLRGKYSLGRSQETSLHKEKL